MHVYSCMHGSIPKVPKAWKFFNLANASMNMIGIKILAETQLSRRIMITYFVL